jgi:hypothetical protein
LQRRDQTLDLTIEDDGIGFDVTSAKTKERRGLGLVGIRERVAQLRGMFRIERGVTAGTTIVVELPARSRATNEPGDGDVGAVTPTPVADSIPSIERADSQANPAFATRGGDG